MVNGEVGGSEIPEHNGAVASGEERTAAAAGATAAAGAEGAAATAEGTEEARLPPRFSYNPEDPSAVCGLVFVKQRITAKVLYKLIKELREVWPELSFIYPQYIVGSNKNTYLEPAEVGQAERKKQEDVLCR